MNQLTRPINLSTPIADTTLPPDRHGQNAVRAQRAREVIDYYRTLNECDLKRAIALLLADFMHLCDRDTLEDGETAMHFFVELQRAAGYYAVHTAPRGGAL